MKNLIEISKTNSAKATSSAKNLKDNGVYVRIYLYLCTWFSNSCQEFVGFGKHMSRISKHPIRKPNSWPWWLNWVTFYFKAA